MRADASMSTLNNGDMHVYTSQMRGNSSSLLSVMSSGKTPRSNSMMITKPTAAQGSASPTPIEGSFIVVDHDARKLSDMGVYKNIGKMTLNTGDAAAIQSLVDRRARFHKNF